MRRFFRIDDSPEDARELLAPAEQQSEPWNGGRRGRCDKCHGSGVVLHRCSSCELDVDPDCVVCHGSVEFSDECPACKGRGRITDDRRRGVSVFPDEAGLYRYMIKRDANLEGCVLVELEGEPSDDEDFDADEGALLVHPTRIVDVREPDWARMRAAACARTRAS